MGLVFDAMKLVLCVLLICVLVRAGAINKDERVVLVAPVLAPPKNTGARGVDTETAKDFPILTVLANGVDEAYIDEPKTFNPQPIYVQKLEDQKLSQHPHQ